jgi:catechol 2,3-dioxygenase-like lactoylglutathione lyase family enzyme
MEQLITDLLMQFERGALTRRQLIQRLALTATASAAAGAAPRAAAAPTKGFTATAVDHISLQVADYGKSRDFYADLLGMQVSDDDGKQARLTFGAAATCLVPRNARQPGIAPKVDHIAYLISDWNQEAVKAELERRGLAPRLDNTSFHVKDPDGFDVQIAGRLKP